MRWQCAVLGLVLAACPPADPKVKARGEAAARHVAAAEQALLVSDTARAVAAAQLALRYQPENPAHVDLLLRAQAADLVVTEGAGASRERWAQARYEASSQIVTPGPHDWLFQAVLALYDYQQGQFSAAERGFTDSVKAKADWYPSHVLLGRSLEQQKKLELAMQSYEMAIKLSSKAPVYLPLGRIYLSRGETTRARELLEKAIVENDGPDVRYELAGLEDQASKFAEATVHLEKAIAFAPRHGPARLSLADHLVALGRLEEAETHYKIASQLGMEPLATRGLGVVQGSRKQWAQAAKSFELVLQLTPLDAATLYLAAEANEQLGKKTDAAALYEKFTAVAATNPKEADRLASAKQRLQALKK